MLKERLSFLVGVLALAFPVIGHAEVVTEWDLKTVQFTVAGRLTAPDSWNVLATTGVAVSNAAAAISGKSAPLIAKINPVPDASLDAAVAAATHAVVLKMISRSEGKRGRGLSGGARQHTGQSWQAEGASGRRSGGRRGDAGAA